MKPIEIIVIIIAALIVVGTVVLAIYRKRKGVNSCGCAMFSDEENKKCGGCMYSSMCHPNNTEGLDTPHDDAEITSEQETQTKTCACCYEEGKNPEK